MWRLELGMDYRSGRNRVIIILGIMRSLTVSRGTLQLQRQKSTFFTVCAIIPNRIQTILQYHAASNFPSTKPGNPPCIPSPIIFTVLWSCSPTVTNQNRIHLYALHTYRMRTNLVTGILVCVTFLTRSVSATRPIAILGAIGTGRAGTILAWLL